MFVYFGSGRVPSSLLSLDRKKYDCVGVSPAYMTVHHICAWSLRKPEQSRALGTRMTAVSNHVDVPVLSKNQCSFVLFWCVCVCVWFGLVFQGRVSL